MSAALAGGQSETFEEGPHEMTAMMEEVEVAAQQRPSAALRPTPPAAGQTEALDDFKQVD